MITLLDVLDDFSVHDVIEILLREPNQNKPFSQFCNEWLLKLENDKIDDNQIKMEI